MNSKFLSFMLLAVIVLSSCEKYEISHYRELEKSKKSWNEFKATSNNSYRYTIVKSSWVGISWNTTLTVYEGRVVERAFRFTAWDESLLENIPAEDRSWIEKGNQVGIYATSAAAPPYTMDQIYEQAKKDWLVKRKNRTVFFETHDNGLISICGYTNDQCIDDCFIGVHIIDIEPVPLAQN
jgi:hypothetical protein